MIREKEFIEAKKRLETSKGSERDRMIIADYTRQEVLAKLDMSLTDCPQAPREFISTICRVYYGTPEIEQFLSDINIGGIA